MTLIGIACKFLFLKDHRDSNQTNPIDFVVGLIKMAKHNTAYQKTLSRKKRNLKKAIVLRIKLLILVYQTGKKNLIF
jgi:hypothetical protein